MTQQAENLFDSIESAQDFLTLLSDTVRDIRADVDSDIAADSQPARPTLALRLVSYNLAKLELHLRTGHRILDDLRSLRREVWRERAAATVPAQSARRGPQPITALNIPATDAKVPAA